MMYEQLLHDFVDGTLDYQGEAVLFNELQANENLRAELKILILMQEAVTHDMPAFSPAADSHDAIFRRLGFAGGAEGAAFQPAYGFRFGFLGKYLQGIIGVMIGAMMMAFLLTAIDYRDVENTLSQKTSPGSRKSSSGTEVRERTAPVSSFSSNASPDDISLRDISANPSPRTTAGAHVAASLRRTTATGHGSGANMKRSSSGGAITQQEGVDVDSEMRNDTEMRNDVRSDIPSSTSSMNAAVTYAEPRRSLLPEPPGDIEAASLPWSGASDSFALPDPTVTEMLPLSIEYRTLVSRSFTPRPEALENRSDALLRDRALALHYQLGNGQGVGIEIGQEEFYQRFEELIPNGGDVILHEQNPVYLWGGVSLRQVFRESSDLRPYLQLTVGGTRVGPMGRMLLGASFDVVPEMQFIGGGEISVLAYGFDGRRYLSPKYALTYGISLRF